MFAVAVSQRFGRLAVDLALLVIAAITALALRENATLEAGKLQATLPYIAIATLVAIPTSLALGLDRAFWRFSALSDFIKVVTWIFVTVLVATAAVFLINRMDGVSRSIPILHALVAVCLLVGTRVTVRARYLGRSRRPDPASIARPGAVARDDCVLIVGVNDLTWLFLRALGELDQDNVRVAGVVATSHRLKRQTVRGHLIYGPDEPLRDIIRILEVHGVRVQRIIVTVDFATLPPAMTESLSAIAREGVIRVESLFDLIGLGSGGGSRNAPGGKAAAHLHVINSATGRASVPAPLDAASIVSRPFWKIKRAGDFVVSAALILALAPVFLAVLCGVALWIGKPVMFWQDRPGRGGRRFRLYKFRTMGPAHGPDGRPVSEEARLSRFGRFLRATRLDELPQLWNILKGDMSFVGPRPLLLVDQIEGETARLLVRPGLTGWAQIMGGRSVGTADKMALDVWYIQNASLLLDLKILLKTVPIVLGGERITSEALRAWEVAAGSPSAVRSETRASLAEPGGSGLPQVGEGMRSVGG